MKKKVIKGYVGAETVDFLLSKYTTFKECDDNKIELGNLFIRKYKMNSEALWPPDDFPPRKVKITIEVE